jgi:ABC-type amino acid transport substrate-binding protein
VISARGVLVPPRAFLQALREAADARGMLLIFDEAQTAFGRIGSRKGAEYFDVVPDIMTMSKTLGGGLPLAAVSTTAAIEKDIHAKHFTYYGAGMYCWRASRPQGLPPASTRRGLRARRWRRSARRARSRWVGMSIDQCAAVVERIRTDLNLPALKVAHIAVNASSRIPLIPNGTVDIECGSTTNTPERPKQVAFSIATFVS